MTHDRVDTAAGLAALRAQFRQQALTEQAQRAADRDPVRTGLDGVWRRLKAWLARVTDPVPPRAARLMLGGIGQVVDPAARPAGYAGPRYTTLRGNKQ
jgi:hypothetical protein